MRYGSASATVHLSEKDVNGIFRREELTAPGLSVGKARASQPLPGRRAVSRRGGLLYLSVFGVFLMSN